ncbi:hypothetical protein [Cloacibacterium normanense]|jgi:hypothetical protein|uniref:hypothetical protein n=1 Tax=Cloacibacterium normanense TaxID=237258 RepID=UPI0035B3F98E
MEKKVNLELRSKILFCALNIENVINNLLVKHLLIIDKTKTKNFANRPGISFQSKIDLLFDIEVISKEELLTIELLMIFRNKFLHDIKYNSYTLVLNDLDNGIRNRFFKFLRDEKFKSENEYDTAFSNLYNKIVAFINEKVEEIDKFQNTKIEFLLFQNNLLATVISESLDLMTFLSNFNNKIENIVMKKELTNKIVEFEKKIDFKNNVNKLSEYNSKKIVKILMKTNFK